MKTDDVPAVHERVADAAHHHFENDVTGHGVKHLWRVYRLGRPLADEEGADFEVVGAAALVHDLHRVRGNAAPTSGRGRENASGSEATREQRGFVHPRETIPEIREILAAADFPPEKVDAVCHCVEHHEEYEFATDCALDHDPTVEERVVRDADNLDGLGAIGLGRTFTFGAHHGQGMYDPEREIDERYDREKRDNTVIQHVREKLLRLPDVMETETGRALAEERAAFVEAFVEQFEAEWHGER